MLRNTKQTVIKLLKKDTYLAIINNACGARLWSNNYGLINGKKIDLVENGNLSCAFFVSSILKIFDLINSLHLTVLGTEKDLIKNNWKRIKVSKKMPPGTVIIWEAQMIKDDQSKQSTAHYHIGFYLGNEKAVSTWTYHNFPIIHHWTYNNTRKIIKAYYHTFLNT